LNHFTVPVAMKKHLLYVSRTVDGRRSPTRYSLLVRSG
jgi:hypothetical protein